MARHNPIAWRKYCEQTLDVDFYTDTVATITNVWLDPSRYLFLLGEDGYRKIRPPLIPRGPNLPQWNKYEILIDEEFRGRIYVKGMLVQIPQSNWGGDYSNAFGGNHGGGGGRHQNSRHYRGWYFGYNLLDFEIRSRDRFNSLTRQEETSEVIGSWHEVLNNVDFKSAAGITARQVSYLQKASRHHFEVKN